MYKHIHNTQTHDQTTTTVCTNIYTILKLTTKRQQQYVQTYTQLETNRHKNSKVNYKLATWPTQSQLKAIIWSAYAAGVIIDFIKETHFYALV